MEAMARVGPIADAINQCCALTTNTGLFPELSSLSLGAAAVASCLAAVLSEIYLCNVCSCQEILRRNGRG
eukprot:COSAG01_NODE_4660_length_4842_cov_22.777567_8_plen_70_part_00